MDEIQQEIRKIMVSINRIDGIYYQWAKRIGLKDNMLALLYALSDGNLHSQKQISEEWLIPKTTINTVIQECIQKDYVVLQQEPHSKERFTPKWCSKTCAMRNCMPICRQERPTRKPLPPYLRSSPSSCKKPMKTLNAKSKEYFSQWTTD